MLLAQTRRRLSLHAWCFPNCRSILGSTDLLVQGRVSQGIPWPTSCCWRTLLAPECKKIVQENCTSSIFQPYGRSGVCNMYVPLWLGFWGSGSCLASEVMGSAANICCRGASAGELHLSNMQKGQQLSPTNAN